MAASDHLTLLAGRIAATHKLLVETAQATTDEDLLWRPGPASPPIAFHLWHTGRWADRWAEVLRVASGGKGSQRWVLEKMAEAWKFPSSLGTGDTGMELPDDEAAALPYPGHGALTTYLRGAFNDLEQAIRSLDDESILADADDLRGGSAPIEDSLIRHLAHVSRHLGMIEALRGLRGGRDTATV